MEIKQVLEQLDNNHHLSELEILEALHKIKQYKKELERKLSIKK